MSSRPTANLAEAIAQGGHLIFRNADWDGYERFAAYFGKRGLGKVSYSNGILEVIGNESLSHELVSRLLGHLIGAYGILLGLNVFHSGGATIGSKEKDASKNPDESFWFDREPVANAGPDLVIEVVMTSEAIGKQEFYARFAIPELWIWEAGEIQVFLLKANGKGYKASKRSRMFPALDLKLVERCCQMGSLTEADAAFRAAVKS